MFSICFINCLFFSTIIELVQHVKEKEKLLDYLSVIDIIYFIVRLINQMYFENVSCRSYKTNVLVELDLS